MDENKSDDSKIYWANLPAEKIGKPFIEKVDSHFEFASSIGVLEQAQKSYDAYYGKPFNSSEGNATELTTAGDQEELTKLRVNHFANIARHQLNIVSSDRPAMVPVATKTDSRALGDAVFYRGILDAYQRKLDFDRLLTNACFYAILFGDGFLWVEWDASLGDAQPTAALVPGAPQTNGDLKLSALTPFDLVKDAAVDRYEDSAWVGIRTWVNKFALVAKYPAFAEKIMSLPDRDMTDHKRFDLSVISQKSDLIPLYTLLHKKDLACPTGRIALILEDETCIAYDEMRYPEFPVYRIAPEDYIGTPHGHTLMYDVLVIQECLDLLYSVVMSNQLSFGHQNLLVPDNANLDFEALRGGLNIIRYSAKLMQANIKPEVLDMLSTPKEIFGFIEQLEKTMELLSAINPTLRGQPPANLESGAALVMVHTQAISFLNNLAQARNRLIEQVGTGIVKTLKAFATVPHKVALAGKAKQYILTDFTNQDLEGLEGVMVEQVSPMSKTYAGKMDLGEKLLMSGQINAKQFLTMVNTGELEVLTEAGVKENILVLRENEMLAEGKLVADPHLLENQLQHIQEHAGLVADPDLRVNKPDVYTNTMAHIMKHVQLLSVMDPVSQALLQLTGQTPLMLAGMVPPQGPGANPNGSQPTQPGSQPGLHAKAPKGPQAPTNPETGDKWTPPGGSGNLPPGSQ